MRLRAPFPNEVADALGIERAALVDTRRCGHAEPFVERRIGAGVWYCCVGCGLALAARDVRGRILPEPRYCPVPGCGFSLAGVRILCGPHWFTVPPALRAAVWREFRRGRGTPAHVAAVRAAVEAARQEAARRGNRGGARRE